MQNRGEFGACELRLEADDIGFRWHACAASASRLQAVPSPAAYGLPQMLNVVEGMLVTRLPKAEEMRRHSELVLWLWQTPRQFVLLPLTHEHESRLEYLALLNERAAQPGRWSSSSVASSTPSPAPLPPVIGSYLGSLVIHEVDRWLRDELEPAYLLIDSGSLALRRLPAKLSGSQLRRRRHLSYRDRAFESLQDLPPGLLAWSLGNSNPPIYRAYARSRLPFAATPLNWGNGTELAYGRAQNFRAAEVASVLEALERNCARWSGQLATVCESYRNLSRTALTLNPSSLVLPQPRRGLERPSFIPFSEDLVIDWVKGYSCKHKAAIYVPARCAFMDYRRDPAFLRENSSGFALGSSLAEAALYAVFEVLERDAAHMTWYTKTSPLNIELVSLTDPGICNLLDFCKERCYEVSVLRSSYDTPLSSVIVSARSERPERPYFHLTSAAHLSPERAIYSALLEVASSIEWNATLFRTERADQLAEHPETLREPFDYFLYYGSPKNRIRLEFLFQGATVSFEQAFSQDLKVRSNEGVEQALARLAQKLFTVFSDLIIIDVSEASLRKAGLHCAKVLLPDALPLSFGHNYRRVYTCKRLMSALGASAWSALDTAQIEHLEAPPPFW